jgi:hypothetical protein
MRAGQNQLVPFAAGHWHVNRKVKRNKQGKGPGKGDPVAVVVDLAKVGVQNALVSAFAAHPGASPSSRKIHRFLSHGGGLPSGKRQEQGNQSQK